MGYSSKTSRATSFKRKVASMPAAELEQLIAGLTSEVDALTVKLNAYSSCAERIRQLEARLAHIRAKITETASKTGSVRRAITQLFNSTESERQKAQMSELKCACENVERDIRTVLPSGIKTSSALDSEISRTRSAIAYKTTGVGIYQAALGKKRREEVTLTKKAAERAAMDRREAELKARVAAAEKKSRETGWTVKRKLHPNEYCPYCFGRIDDCGHADHIYPIVKGGLSTETNMVIVCSTCNSRKGPLTLRQFIERYGLDRDAVEAALTLLGKVF
jgi:5-methylcytosine-specific restriction endonuclease McrA